MTRPRNATQGVVGITRHRKRGFFQQRHIVHRIRVKKSNHSVPIRAALVQPLLHARDFTRLKARRAENLTGKLAIFLLRRRADNMLKTQTPADRLDHKLIGRAHQHAFVTGILMPFHQIQRLRLNHRLDQFGHKLLAPLL